MNVPNKPMVPTTDSAPAEPARRSGRRHIGQPLGGHEASSDEWTAPEQEAREIRHSLVAYPACVELAAFIGSWFATGAQGGNDK